MSKSLQLGVLVSGRGTNLQALIDAVKGGTLDAEIALVISDKPEAYALRRAEDEGIPTQVLLPETHATRQAYDAALAARLLERGVDLVILAGFMRVLSGAFLGHFPNRVLNIHPALLPDHPEEDEVRLPDGTKSPVFRGIRAVRQALEAGVSWTGCTVHLVTLHVDRGPVVKRQAVQVLPGDTEESLHARIQKEEHRILPEAVAWWAKSCTV